MITLNNKKFAKTEAEFTDSLFESGGTCVGYYKTLKKQVQLFNHQKEQIGAINNQGVLCSSTTLESGKLWYSYANPCLIGEYDYSTQQTEVNEILNNNNIIKVYR